MAIGAAKLGHEFLAIEALANVLNALAVPRGHAPIRDVHAGGRADAQNFRGCQVLSVQSLCAFRAIPLQRVGNGGIVFRLEKLQQFFERDEIDDDVVVIFVVIPHLWMLEGP